MAALASGVALALSFPRADLHALVWVAIVPLLLAIEGRDPVRGWWLGLVTGAAFRAVNLYWILPTLTGSGDLRLPVAAVATASLILYLAAYVGIFGFVAARFRLRRPGAVPALAATWVGLELVQSRLLGGFPWCLVGYAAGRSTLLGQAADLVGVHGLSFAAILVGAAIAKVIVDPASGRRPASWAAGAVALLLLYGGARLSAAPAASPPSTPPGGLSVGIVQGNVPQGRKWDPRARDSILRRHLRLSRRAAAEGAELIVWPEASIPNPYGITADPEARRRLRRLARESGASILFGSPHVERRRGSRGRRQTNAAFLLDGRGRWRGRYDKVRLVPFGEYLPWRDWLPFLDPLVVTVADLRAGPEDQALLREPRTDRRLGVAICYEILYPESVRRRVVRGANLLVTLTNDAWYGESSAPHQHMAMARMRAVEVRRPLVRAANTGISAVVDRWGRTRRRLELNRTGLLVESVAPTSTRTPYLQWGYLFPYLCALLAISTAGPALWPTRSRGRRAATRGEDGRRSRLPDDARGTNDETHGGDGR